MKTLTKTDVINMVGSRDGLVAKRRSIKKQILEMHRDNKRGSCIICSHNTILVLLHNGKADFVVDQNSERGLTPIRDLTNHLAVGRYEPTTAKEWMKEDLVVSCGDTPVEEGYYKKAIMGERELRNAVIGDKLVQLDVINSLLQLHDSVA